MDATRKPVKQSANPACARASDCPRAAFGIYSGIRNLHHKWFMNKRLPTKQRPRDRPNRFHAFLRRLRAGGRSNMYGAIPYLMHAFALDRESAFRIVCEWVDQHAEEEGRAPASSAR